MGQGQGCCSASHDAQDDPTTKNDLDPNTHVAEVETLEIIYENGLAFMSKT